MREYLFLIVLFFSANLIAQQTKEEQHIEKKSKERTNNVAPAYNNAVESEMDEAPAGKTLDKIQSQSIVLESASQNLQQIFQEVKYNSSQKSPSPKQFQKLNYELIKIKNVNENAFEYHLYNYKVGNYNFDRIDDLKAAAKLQPNHPEVLKELSAYHYILNDEAALKQQLIKMDAAKHFSSELTGFASDVLKSLPKNAILLTHGDDDTYPLLIEQYVKGTRKDIEIVSLDHLQSETYRIALKKKGVELPNSTIINTDYFKAFVKDNKRDLIVATTFPKSYLQTVKGQLHVNGLGFSIGSLNNDKVDARLSQLYENTIKYSLQNNKVKGHRRLQSNYLPLLFEVRNNWLEAGDLDKVKEIEDEIIEIGRQTGKLEQILKMLK